ncbi:MAG: trehalose-6-phosphate synthase [Polyangiaceae bacterium]
MAIFMTRVVRFLLILILGLGALCWGTYEWVVSTSRRWLDTDVELRARVVVSSARPTLVANWQLAHALEESLSDIARDERIMAVAACDTRGMALAKTNGFPTDISCADEMLAGALRGEQTGARRTLRGGSVRVSGIPVTEGGNLLGVAILVHDLSYADRREAATRNVLFVAFAIAILGSMAVALIAARLSWHGFIENFRRALRGERVPAFQPLLRDVRELSERLASMGDAEPNGFRWTPQRLKSSLREHLEGERIVIVANREPYIHERTENGDIKVLHPASGLVTALEPVVRACSGVWVAHGSGSADRDTVDAHSRVLVPPGDEDFAIRRVWLTDEEERGYYYGFSNEGLWPLCHVAHTRPVFRAEDWEHYRDINQRFADAACSEVDRDDPIILVQDYHFALAPRMIRKRLPRATILTFWHVPWPNAERFGICPWRNELIEGILGSSIVGFHTQQHCNHFLDAVDTFVESRIDREHSAVVQGARQTLIRPYPISIEWPVHWLESTPSAEDCRAHVFKLLGLAPDALLGIGIDRLDYTKGIEERLLAVERLLERHPEYRGRLTFAQLAAPSRTRIERYQDLNDTVERVAERINRRFGNGDYRPIALLRSHHEPPTVYRYYRAADFCYVSSLHDGMNLVAKEFVAARSDEKGVLILSQFTGAARELTEALVVNPYDLEQASSAMSAALSMGADEQRDRMHAMRTLVSELNVYRWAGRMLVDAASLRRRDRLEGKLSRSWSSARGVG